jgi:hypothetical protein
MTVDRLGKKPVLLNSDECTARKVVAPDH